MNDPRPSQSPDIETQVNLHDLVEFAQRHLDLIRHTLEEYDKPSDSRLREPMEEILLGHSQLVLSLMNSHYLAQGITEIIDDVGVIGLLVRLINVDPEAKVNIELQQRANELYGLKHSKECFNVKKQVRLNLQSIKATIANYNAGSVSRDDVIASANNFFKMLGDKPTDYILVFRELITVEPEIDDILQTLEKIAPNSPLVSLAEEIRESL